LARNIFGRFYRTLHRERKSAYTSCDKINTYLRESGIKLSRLTVKEPDQSRPYSSYSLPRKNSHAAPNAKRSGV